MGLLGRLAPRGLAPHLVFAAIALAFCAPYLLPGNVLLPTGLHTFPPWIGDVGAPGDRPTNELMADALVLTLPARVLNHDALRAGTIPFWNPRIYGGYPHFAMIQNNTLYPPSAVFDLVDPYWSMGASICLHLALAGSLMFLFLRGSALSSAASAVGGAAFELNGMFLIRASSPSYVFTGTWLPLLLLGARALARGGSTRRAGAQLALGSALTVLGGHPQMAAMSFAASAALFACDIAGERRAGAGPAGREVARRAAWLACWIALGVALVGFQVVPFAEFLRESSREVVSLQQVLASALPAPGLLQGILPDVFGHPVDGTYWFDDLAPLLDGRPRSARYWALNYSGENVFTGWAPLVLAAVALVRPARPRDVALFAGMALVSLAVVLGTPLLALAYAAVPGFAYSRPDRVLFLYMAAVAALAGHGFESIATADDRPRTRRIALAAAIALAAELAWTSRAWLLDGARRRAFGDWLVQAWEHAAALPVSGARQLAVALAILAACAWLARRRLSPTVAAAAWIAAIAVPNAWFGWKFNPVQPRPSLGGTATERAVAAHAGGRRLARVLESGGRVLPANVTQILGVDDVHGASAAGLERYLAVMSAFDRTSVSRMKYFPEFRDRRVADGPLFDLLSVGLVLSDVPLPAPWRAVSGEDAITLYDRPDALARFHFVSEVERVPDVASAIARVTSADFAPARRAVVVARNGAGNATAGSASSGAGGDAGAGRVAVVSDTPHGIALDVDAPSAGVVVTSEVDYPGWESDLDGVRADTLLVNGAFRGVAVPAGSHRVRFRYVPRSFYAGVAVSVVAALAWIALARLHRS
ncbi:MAG TPA: hypothetical protein VFD92_07865 [Candidatus Binatia bacterium]|nr:hypothetical protein [Candidatus Binatia bacterium]